MTSVHPSPVNQYVGRHAYKFLLLQAAWDILPSIHQNKGGRKRRGGTEGKKEEDRGRRKRRRRGGGEEVKEEGRMCAKLLYPSYTMLTHIPQCIFHYSSLLLFNSPSLHLTFILVISVRLYPVLNLSFFSYPIFLTFFYLPTPSMNVQCCYSQLKYGLICLTTK